MFRELSKTYAFWFSIFLPIILVLHIVIEEFDTAYDYIMLGLLIFVSLLSIGLTIFQTRQIKKKGVRTSNKRPTHWTLGYSFKPELGFDDGTYMIREGARIFYPEYFDENGEPKLDMLPLDGQDRKKWWKEHQKEIKND